MSKEEKVIIETTVNALASKFLTDLHQASTMPDAMMSVILLITSLVEIVSAAYGDEVTNQILQLQIRHGQQGEMS